VWKLETERSKTWKFAEKSSTEPRQKGPRKLNADEKHQTCWSYIMKKSELHNPLTPTTGTAICTYSKWTKYIADVSIWSKATQSSVDLTRLYYTCDAVVCNFVCPYFLLASGSRTL